jgi:amino acid transporter
MSTQDQVTEVTDLKEGAMSGWQAFVITLGYWCPGLLMLSVPIGVWYGAGNGTWLALTFSIIAILAIAACITVFAKKFVGTGGIYSYAEAVWGRWARVIMGAGVIGGYACILLLVVPNMILFGSAWMVSISPSLGGTLPQIIITGAVIAATTFFAIRGLEESVRVMYLLLAIATPIAFALCLAAAIKGGVNWSAQFSLEGVSASSMARGIAFGLAMFVGFEACTAMAYETRNPNKAMPRLAYGIPFVFFLLFLFGTFTQINAFNTNLDAIASGVSPITVLGNVAGAHWLGTTASVTAWIAMTGGLLGQVTFSARVLASLASDGLMPRALAKVGKRQTPAVAIVALAILTWAAPWVFLLSTGKTALDVYVWIGTFFALWWVPLYIAICVAATWYLVKSEKRWSPFVLVAGVVGSAAMVYTFASNFIWPPSGSLQYAVWVFVVGFAILFVGLVIVTHRQLSTSSRKAEDVGIDTASVDEVSV